jgi:Ulp1 family protease
MSNNSVYYPTLPQISPGGSSLPAPQSNVQAGTPVYDLINKIAGYLTPQKAYKDVTSYEDVANPYRKAASNFITTNLRPEFQRNIFNPANNNLMNENAQNLAQSGGASLGNSAKVYQDKINAINTPLFNQEEQVKAQFENFARDIYGKKIQEYYNSPTAFNNIGAAKV